MPRDEGLVIVARGVGRTVIVVTVIHRAGGEILIDVRPVPQATVCLHCPEKLCWIERLESRCKSKGACLLSTPHTRMHTHPLHRSMTAEIDPVDCDAITTRQPAETSQLALFSYILPRRRSRREHVQPISASIARVDASEFSTHAGWTFLAAYHAVADVVLPVHKGQLRHSPPGPAALSSELWADQRHRRGG